MQAIMDEPKYLILDEPFDALDQKSQEKVKDMLNDYITDDKILIFTSHNINHEEFADITFEINDKKLIQAKQHTVL
jgi:ABC-2 type transport system ATP-binding protein